ncbi:DUF309 domain-containing protein [Emcibacter sp. SYSU 3D8]|uniref:DUF309 domain-containing protein n=1 Tax=Emcibacter sp. SYSU 3D8 TaxID=3133969 RepID=UPI0031FECF05
MIRYLPDEPFPAYAYRPGRDPHPVRDPRGHSYGLHSPAPPVPDPARWRDSRDYLRGIDLFNAGYYWEAHEAWEGLWNACGRTGPTALLMQALIALTAAGVKVRAGNGRGAASHARRAERMLMDLAATAPLFMGLKLSGLAANAAGLAHNPAAAGEGQAVLGLVLEPA